MISKYHRIILVVILSASLSIITLWCAEPLMSSSLKNSSLWLKQLIWYILGLLLIIFMNHLNPNRIKCTLHLLYWLLMIFLFLLWIDRYLYDFPDSFIRSINGTTAWIILPGLGSIQPSEFMKVLMVIRTGSLIEAHFDSLSFSNTRTDLQLFAKVFITNLIPMILILLQPDTGIPIIILFSIGSMLMTSPIQRKWIVSAFGIIILVFLSILLIYHFMPELFSQLGGYRLKRISGWLNPEATMKNEGYQLYTSLLMLGSCGYFGCGIKKRIISIPEAHTDFIFTVIAQNFGLLGTISALVLCVLLDFHLSSLIFQETNPYRKRIKTGLFSCIVFQQVQNIAMVTGLLPITGIPLPFFSYGGSSILSSMLILSLFLPK